MAPFLHGHIGASHIEGFHIDGVSIGHVDHPGPVSMSTMTDVDDESPALGVAASVPKSGDEGWSLIDAGWLFALLLVLAHAPAPQPCLRAARTHLPRSTYRAGWPPPAFAPPSSSRH